MSLVVNKPLNAGSIVDAHEGAIVDGFINDLRKQGYDDIEISMYLKKSLPSEYHSQIEKQLGVA